ncbi:hypothetical protein Lal_00039292 [Lupinus albus]|nr:hypothetical protein Lal_00039292 [Lupinus albus]
MGLGEGGGRMSGLSWVEESHYFDIYVGTRDNCGECAWIISPSGTCKLISDTNHFVCYPWNVKEQHELQRRKGLLISNTTTPQEPYLPVEPVNSQGRE